MSWTVGQTERCLTSTPHFLTEVKFDNIRTTWTLLVHVNLFCKLVLMFLLCWYWRLWVNPLFSNEKKNILDCANLYKRPKWIQQIRLMISFSHHHLFLTAVPVRIIISIISYHPGLLFLSVSSNTHRRPQNNPTSNQDFNAISFQRVAKEILKPKRGVRICIFSTKYERRAAVIADEISQNLRQFCTELWLSLIDTYSRAVCSCAISKA